MIPIEVAQKVLEECSLRQIILFGWDGTATHITTQGFSIQDGAQAAAGANAIKKQWGWPESTIAESARVQALLDKIKHLENDVEELESRIRYLEDGGESNWYSHRQL